MLAITMLGSVSSSLAISLSEAKTIALGLVAVFVVAAVLAIWIIKSIFQKLLAVAILAVFGFAVWTQRASLQDCADKVIDAYEFDGVSPTLIDTECSFFGTTITISDPRTPTDVPTPTTANDNEAAG